MFQLTHPRMVRLRGYSCPRGGTPGFNSRTREGCDRQQGEYHPTDNPFQLTHPRRVRPEQARLLLRFTE
ncbi:hypothetical protein, partial [Porphyromonas loveana]|uniref:hypothetical protein n=1 Tax=Porphyromonas loveana TaxID=1884669 RepID=UPI00403A6A29